MKTYQGGQVLNTPSTTAEAHKLTSFFPNLYSKHDKLYVMVCLLIIKF